jgi:hypothetical protein
MAVPSEMDALSVNLQPEKGGDEILQRAIQALSQLPNARDVEEWSVSACKKYLSKNSDLWAKLWPVVNAMSKYVPTAAPEVWEHLLEASRPSHPGEPEDMWVCLRTDIKADPAFSKFFLKDLLLCVVNVREALSPTWRQQGTASMLLPLFRCSIPLPCVKELPMRLTV